MTSTPTHYDSIIVGAGFGGVKLLHDLRKTNLSVHGFEKGTALGGVWHHNRYPGARVDSEVPVYQLFIKEVWEDWNFKERFPGWREIQEYFAHADKKLNISKDYTLLSTVTAAHWNDATNLWTVTVEGNGAGTYTCKYLLLCTGFAAKKLLPACKNREAYTGICFHTADWPWQGVETKGKKVGIIGTGASGVQVIQEIGREVELLTVFQRSINNALPMRQRELTVKEQQEKKGEYEQLLNGALKTNAGHIFNNDPRNAVDCTPEERQEVFDRAWKEGGFRFWGGNFSDTITNDTTNQYVYDYWREQVAKRVTDPHKLEILAPKVRPYPIYTKRPSLEQWYYEIYNQENVDIVDVKKEPIIEYTPTGLRTGSTEYDFDVIVLATGFDAVTGGFDQIDIRGQNGVTLKEHWKDQTNSYLGMTIGKMPNLFFLYGPHGPTAFSNGPSSTAIQSDWIVDTMVRMEKEGKTYIVPTPEAEQAWYTRVNDLCAQTMLGSTKSWYMGSNVPGKKVEALNYVAGLPAYEEELTTANGFVYGTA